MMTIKEVSQLTGVSARTLRYYDQIGLLKPSQITMAGYRLYDEPALEKLQQILLFRSLSFPLKEIKEMIDAPNFDREKALDQQITLLTMKKEQLEKIIDFARKLKSGDKQMDFSVFDTKKTAEYAKQAKAQWGNTDEYKEFEEKTKNQTDEGQKETTEAFMRLFAEFGTMRDLKPTDAQVQIQVKKLQDYISAHYYQCGKTVLSSLGKMYAADPAFKENIDHAGGDGTAVFVSKAIAQYCK